MKFLFVLLLPFVSFAQFIPLPFTTTGGAGGITDCGTCSDGTCSGGNTETGTPNAPAGNTTSSVVTGTLTLASTCTLEVVVLSSGTISGAGVYTITSALGNSWHCLPAIGSGAPVPAICYAFDHSGAALATGAETVTVSFGSAWFPSLAVKAFKGTLTTSSVIDTNGNSSTLTCSNLVVAATNELVVCGLFSQDAGAYSLGGGYTTAASVPFSSGVNWGTGFGWSVVAGSGTITGPTWTTGGSVADDTAAAAFKHP